MEWRALPAGEQPQQGFERTLQPTSPELSPELSGASNWLMIASSWQTAEQPGRVVCESQTRFAHATKMSGNTWLGNEW
jgi:hypothetical protein